jgi:hypothetical protein
MAVVGAVSVWWKPRPAQLLSTGVGIGPWQLFAAPKRRPAANKDDALYDMCLAAGNTVVACNAFMRLLNPQPPRPYSLSCCEPRFQSDDEALSPVAPASQRPKDRLAFAAPSR